ncbi:hypothetical protein PENTCL1PPCAC_20936, partial [Pristionchus entomophagus]
LSHLAAVHSQSKGIVMWSPPIFTPSVSFANIRADLSSRILILKLDTAVILFSSLNSLSGRGRHEASPWIILSSFPDL